MSEYSAPSQPFSPEMAKVEPDQEKMNTTQLPTNPPEQLSFKNRLQEYTQKSDIPLPVYQTINEGVQHSPNFRSTVLVDGEYYRSPNVFSNRKAAEQDVARIALFTIAQKIKNEGSPLIHEDTVFCKSILNEYAVKMNLEKPIYNTIQPKGLLPVFVSSLVFNSVIYSGDSGRNKKEAEQLAARAVILSILDSESGIIISEIIKSKFKLYAALNKVKDSRNIHNGAMPMGMHNLGYNIGIPLSTGKEVEVAGGTDNMTITAIPEPCSGQPTNIPATCPPLSTYPPLCEFRKSNPDASSGAITTPIVFVRSVMEQPLLFGSTSGRKRNRKNKKNAQKKVRIDDPQLAVAVVPLTQAPQFSVAQ